MTTISNWNDAYVALKHRAEDARGFIEINPDTPDRERWPRTTGADVVAIAALVDPHVRALRSMHGTLAVQRRWDACRADIARHALVAPGNTYPENRELWRCLAAAFVLLASIDAPLPDAAMWAVLLDELGHVLAIRNVGPKGDGPFKHFDNVKTFDDLYTAQSKFLRETRGFDEIAAEAGMSGLKKKIPRTTNADVIALADYWNKQLGDVKKVMGHDGVVARWKAAFADVDQIARTRASGDLYPKNNGFWRTLQSTAIHIAVADEAPTKWDMALDSLKDSVKNLPDNLTAGAKKVASGIADVSSEVAQGVGKIANKAGQGLFSGMGVPLLIGGGLLGVFLISRARGRKDEV